MSDFKIGDSVLAKDSIYEGEAKIIAIDTEDFKKAGCKIIISWGGSYKPYTVEYSANELILLTPKVRQKNALLVEEIEHDISKSAELLEMAWELFDQARQKVYNENLPTDLGNMNIEDFKVAAGKFGWSSSSLYC